MTGSWGGSAAQISVEQFSEAPQRGYRLRLRGASVDVDVDTSVWRRRKWARLWWRHDPWGDAATPPAAAEPCPSVPWTRDRRYPGTNIEHCLDISGVELWCAAWRGKIFYYGRTD